MSRISQTFRDLASTKLAVQNHPAYPRMDEDYRAVIEERAIAKIQVPPSTAYRYVLDWAYEYLYNGAPLPEFSVRYKDQQGYNNLFL